MSRRSAYHEELDVILEFPGTIFQGTSEPRPELTEVPADGETYTVAGTATVLGQPGVVVVMGFNSRLGHPWFERYDASTHEWSSCTPDVDAWTAPQQVVAHVPPREAELAAWEAQHRVDAPWPAATDTVVEHWRAALGHDARRPELDEGWRTRCEKYLRQPLPPQLAACLSAADGGGPLFGVRDLIEEWLVWDAAYADMHYDDIFGCDIGGDGQKTHGAYFLRDWIPFGRRGYEVLALDGCPAPEGTKGQVIAFNRDGPKVEWLAPDLSTFLQALGAPDTQ